MKLIDTQVNMVANDCALILEQHHSALSMLKNTVMTITGGTGFVGTWIAEFLAHLNDHYGFNTQVILIAKNIEHFKKTKPHLSARHDITLIATDIRYLMELPAETNWIIHAAGTPDNRVHATYPLETMSVIANGTLALLRAAERCCDLKMLLHVSSGLIYGSQSLQHAQMNEAYEGAPKCSTVSSAYAEAKRYAETLCHSARSQSRIPVVTARPFAFMGPYQALDAPWAVNNFIKDALSGNAIRVLGDGETVRSYLYASDMAYWLLSILVRGQSGEIYNVGSPEPITLTALANLIVNEFASPLEIKLRTSYANQLQHSRFVPDVSHAQQQLQLPISVTLQDAVRRTVAWNKLL